MQRTTQREKAFVTTISPNSNSDSSALRGETKCEDETIPDPARLPMGGGDFAVLRVMMPLHPSDNINNLSTFYS
jgi:hypothetical protein